MAAAVSYAPRTYEGRPPRRWRILLRTGRRIPVGRRLPRWSRPRSAMTATEVARELGLSKAMVLLIERRALAKLAVGLGFDVSDLGTCMRRYLRACRSCGKLAIATGFPKEMAAHRDCHGCAGKRRAERRRHG